MDRNFNIDNQINNNSNCIQCMLNNLCKMYINLGNFNKLLQDYLRIKIAQSGSHLLNLNNYNHLTLRSRKKYIRLLKYIKDMVKDKANIMNYLNHYRNIDYIYFYKHDLNLQFAENTMYHSIVSNKQDNCQDLNSFNKVVYI